MRTTSTNADDAPPADVAIDLGPVDVTLTGARWRLYHGGRMQSGLVSGSAAERARLAAHVTSVAASRPDTVVWRIGPPRPLDSALAIRPEFQVRSDDATGIRHVFSELASVAEYRQRHGIGAALSPDTPGILVVVEDADRVLADPETVRLLEAFIGQAAERAIGFMLTAEEGGLVACGGSTLLRDALRGTQVQFNDYT
jgi:hypothetical protein